MSERTEYHSGKLGAMVNLMISIVKKNPQVLDNPDFLKAQMKMAMPELARKDVCPNCDASMVEYTFNFDAWDAILLLKMAQEVQNRRHKGIEFTVANQVRVPELPVSHAVKCRTTQASKLGLVAQLRSKGDKRVAGVWVITKRGWEALAGNPVPAKVKVWRGRIEERFDETITLAKALKSHIEFVENTVKKGREPKQDFRDIANEYNPTHWYEFSMHEGKLF